MLKSTQEDEKMLFCYKFELKQYIINGEYKHFDTYIEDISFSSALRKVRQIYDDCEIEQVYRGTLNGWELLSGWEESNKPVLSPSPGSAVHHHYFACPSCGHKVGGFIIIGEGENDWTTHKDNYCPNCGHRIIWDGVDFSDIYTI
jgi:DNA-directed RNA polymerase subunit RPC12/RpoP